MLQLHLRQVHLQLFGDQHRDGGIGALAHLDIGHGQDNPSIASDADKGVRHEAVGRFGFAVLRTAGSDSASGLRPRPHRLAGSCAGRDRSLMAIDPGCRLDEW